MTSKDNNSYNDYRPTADNETTWPVADTSRTQDSVDNYAPLSTLSQLSTAANNETSRSAVSMEVSPSMAVDDVSIYSVRTNLKRNLILAAVSLTAFLLPFCDTVYLPALNAIQKEFNTTQTLVAVSVSIYLFMNGVFSLLWGPMSDRLGRKIALITLLSIFVAVSLICIFAPNIAVFIVFRALQGATVSGTLVIGQGVVADIYPAKNRGSATGIFFVPVLIGPIVGPLIGGALAEAFNWRSTFIFLTLLSFIILMIIVFLVPETHQYFVKERFHRANPNKRITDAEPNEKPTFKAPWKPLIFLTDLSILPYIIVATTTFTGLFISLTLFSNYLHEDPYNYSETIIGVLFVPTGVIMLIGSLLGGWLSDKSSLHYRDEICPEGRIVPAMAFSILTPIGLIIYGWTFHYKTYLAGPIISQVVLGFGQSVLQPGVYAYLTAKKQKEAAAASAANTVLNFCGAGIGVTVAVPIQDAIGRGPFFSIICGINVVAIVVASILLFKRIRGIKQITVQTKDIALGVATTDDNMSAYTNGHATVGDHHPDDQTAL